MEIFKPQIIQRPQIAIRTQTKFAEQFEGLPDYLLEQIHQWRLVAHVTLRLLMLPILPNLILTLSPYCGPNPTENPYLLS